MDQNSVSGVSKRVLNSTGGTVNCTYVWCWRNPGTGCLICWCYVSKVLMLCVSRSCVALGINDEWSVSSLYL